MLLQRLRIAEATAIFQHLRRLRRELFPRRKIRLPINITLSQRQMCVAQAIVVVNVAGLKLIAQRFDYSRNFPAVDVGMACIQQSACLRKDIKQRNILGQIEQQAFLRTQTDVFYEHLHTIFFAQIDNLAQTADNTRLHSLQLLRSRQLLVRMHNDKVSIYLFGISTGFFPNLDIVFLLCISKIYRHARTMDRQAAFTPGRHLLVPVIILAKLIKKFNTIAAVQLTQGFFHKAREQQVANFKVHILYLQQQNTKPLAQCSSCLYYTANFALYLKLITFFQIFAALCIKQAHIAPVKVKAMDRLQRNALIAVLQIENLSCRQTQRSRFQVAGVFDKFNAASIISFGTATIAASITMMLYPKNFQPIIVQMAKITR